MNRRRTAYIVVLLWVISAGLGSVQVLVGEGMEAEQVVPNMTIPLDNKCVMELHPAYAIVSSTMSFFLPAAIMVFLYTKLYLYARAHARSIRSQLRAVTGVLMVSFLLYTYIPVTTKSRIHYVAVLERTFMPI